MATSFIHSVFVNCPFDDDYFPLLRPLLFTLRYLGFSPRIALESMNSSQPRIQKIIELIASCRLAIHDISRMRAKEAGEISRFNMPFELGLDIGCAMYKSGKWKNKKCLILDEEKYRYQKAISDLSNSDIETHGNEPIRLVSCVRGWLVSEELGTGPSGTDIWLNYNEFWLYLQKALKAREFTEPEIHQLPINEYMYLLDEWMKK